MAQAPEELSTNLSSYKLQLRQVEAALTNQPNNEELLALQQNLQEVIDLTLELIAQVRADVPLNSGVAKAASAAGWSVGDACIALWSEDGEFYDAKIVEIRKDGHCLVEFKDVEVSDVTPISTLQLPGTVAVRKPAKRGELQLEDVPSTSVTMEHRLATKSKHDQLKAQLEARKKKKAKYNEKMKEIEVHREKDANKWKNFQHKAGKKNITGVIKKSIFATSEEAEGKVGVGTCGISGKPMTKDMPLAATKNVVVKKSSLYNPRTN
ncbi:putative Survival of motor neuron-related-splicing factor 30 [Hypsibius exemplaris]|uniref:Survival of motor neuron-related-splicing factor 30 n=1 Tax=Hypsibius exemplaris TaxID=2072580 RepID=A0A1W0X4E1_HYPEX|nr:putative Survival of motor neuron-related-splicing factor 30 [Hypsibius exemplaris]